VGREVFMRKFLRDLRLRVFVDQRAFELWRKALLKAMMAKGRIGQGFREGRRSLRELSLRLR